MSTSNARHGRRLAAAALLLLSCCTSIVGIDKDYLLVDEPLGLPDAAEGSTAEVSTEATTDALVADQMAPDAPIVVNGDFETLGPGCGSWEQAGAVINSSDASVHGGSTSCRMCSSNSNDGMGKAITLPQGPKKFLMEAFLRYDADGGDASSRCGLSVRPPTIGSGSAPKRPFGVAWEAAQYTFPPDASQMVTVYVNCAFDPGGSCMFVDDFTVTPTN